MRWLRWVLRLAIFLAVLGFAVKNTDPVVVRYYVLGEWRAPLVFVLLVFFAAGSVLGMLAGVRHAYRQRREIDALKRQIASAPVPGPAPAAERPVV